MPLLAVVSLRQPGFMILLLAGAVFGMGANPVLLSFGAGVLIARFSKPWREFWNSSNGLLKATIAVLAACLYSFETVIPPASIQLLLRVLGDPTTVGAAGFLLVVIASRRLQRLLEWKPLIWVGQLSYGIYLIHGTVILAGLPWIFSVAAQAGVTSPHGLWYLGLASTGAVSALLAIPLRKYVELPGNRLGKKLARRIEGWQHPRSSAEGAPQTAAPIPLGV